MKVEVLFFGILAEKAETDKISLDGVSDINDLKEALFKKYSILKDYSFQISVNRDLTHDNIVLKDGDEVALLPPFAGG